MTGRGKLLRSRQQRIRVCLGTAIATRGVLHVPGLSRPGVLAVRWVAPRVAIAAERLF